MARYCACYRHHSPADPCIMVSHIYLSQCSLRAESDLKPRFLSSINPAVRITRGAASECGFTDITGMYRSTALPLKRFGSITRAGWSGHLFCVYQSRYQYPMLPERQLVLQRQAQSSLKKVVFLFVLFCIALPLPHDNIYVKSVIAQYTMFPEERQSSPACKDIAVYMFMVYVVYNCCASTKCLQVLPLER